MKHLQHQLVSEIPALRRYARSLLKDVVSADDLVQDCLEKAWKNIDRYSLGTNIRAWLFTIMHNIFMNKIRKTKSMPEILDVDNFAEFNSDVASPSAPIEFKDLVTCMSNLPLYQREILSLIAVEGLSYKEVSNVLSIPIGTVMSRLHRAREELRKMMLESEITDIQVSDNG